MEKEYISDTLSDICIIKNFLEEQEQWFPLREAELEKMMDIIERKDKISLTLGHIMQSEVKTKAFGEYLWSKMKSVTADSRRQELEKELGAVLKDTLEGLEKLLSFLEAVEKLAVTSPFVFADTRYLPKGMNANYVHSFIFAARKTSPLLVHFKRDDKSFFLPDLNNLEELLCQLTTYILNSKQLCVDLEERTKDVARSWSVLNCDRAINFNEKTHGKSIEKMWSHINQLNMIRNNQDVRLTFLFQKSALSFIGLFSQHHSRMLQFLCNLEECARQLDNMKLGANISTVASSSVGVVGGVLSIVGLALAPVTAGVSLALTLSGVGLGVTSGVNSLVTGITESYVNRINGYAAENELKCFMEDFQRLGDCLETVASSEVPATVDEMENAIKSGKRCGTAWSVGKGIGDMVGYTSLQEDVMVKALKLSLQTAKAGKCIPKLASLPDIGLVAKGSPLAISNTLLSYIFNIYSGSMSLSKGSKNEIAQIIRSKTALWRSELDSWEKMHKSLCRGIWRFRRSQTILEQPFYAY